jgi:hypothetical protein
MRGGDFPWSDQNRQERERERSKRENHQQCLVQTRTSKKKRYDRQRFIGARMTSKRNLQARKIRETEFLGGENDKEENHGEGGSKTQG